MSALGDLQKKAWGALLVAHATLTRKLDAALRHRGLPSLEVYDVLLALEDAPNRRMRMVDLAEAVVFSPSGLTRLIDRMQTAGLVERHACPSDRRAIHVAITERGLKTRAESWPAYAELVEEHFGCHLSDEEADGVGRALGRFRSGRANCEEPEQLGDD